MNSIPEPSIQNVTLYLNKWNELQNYLSQEKSIELLFKELCPKNCQIEHVLLKVSVLNDFYSTNIYNTYAVAQHILSIDFDNRLVCNDFNLVNELAQVPIGGKDKKFYSFATKYCNHHSPNVYPIYDYFVVRMLTYYKRTTHFSSFNQVELKDYEKFVRIIEQFQTHFRLTDFTIRQIDIFLWLCGKEFFPRKY